MLPDHAQQLGCKGQSSRSELEGLLTTPRAASGPDAWPDSTAEGDAQLPENLVQQLADRLQRAEDNRNFARPGFSFDQQPLDLAR